MISNLDKMFAFDPTPNKRRNARPPRRSFTKRTLTSLRQRVWQQNYYDPYQRAQVAQDTVAAPAPPAKKRRSVLSNVLNTVFWHGANTVMTAYNYLWTTQRIDDNDDKPPRLGKRSRDGEGEPITSSGLRGRGVDFYPIVPRSPAWETYIRQACLQQQQPVLEEDTKWGIVDKENYQVYFLVKNDSSFSLAYIH